MEPCISGLQRKKSTGTLLFSSSPTSTPNKISPSNLSQILDNGPRLGSPITFFHQGRNVDGTHTLYAPNEHNRKTWSEIIQNQREIKFKRKPLFSIVDNVKRYEFFAEIRTHHMVIFGIYKVYIN